MDNDLWQSVVCNSGKSRFQFNSNSGQSPSIQFRFQFHRWIYKIPIPSCDLSFNSIPIPIPSYDFSLQFHSNSNSIGPENPWNSDSSSNSGIGIAHHWCVYYQHWGTIIATDLWLCALDFPTKQSWSFPMVRASLRDHLKRLMEIFTRFDCDNARL